MPPLNGHARRCVKPAFLETRAACHRPSGSEWRSGAPAGETEVVSRRCIEPQAISDAIELSARGCEAVVLADSGAFVML